MLWPLHCSLMMPWNDSLQRHGTLVLPLRLLPLLSVHLLRFGYLEHALKFLIQETSWKHCFRWFQLLRLVWSLLNL